MAGALNWDSSWKLGISSLSVGTEAGKKTGQRWKYSLAHSGACSCKAKGRRRVAHIGPCCQKRPGWTEPEGRCFHPPCLGTSGQPHPAGRGVSPAERKQHCSQKAVAELQNKPAGVSSSSKQLKIPLVLSRQWLENRRGGFGTEILGGCV